MSAVLTEPHVRRWTKGEFYRLGELGFFAGQKAELLEGEIVVTSPQNWPHAAAVDRVTEVLRRVFGTTAWVRSHLPLDLGQVSEPEADVSVVPGKRTDYTAHPTTALLVVEVSDSTLWFDRGRKASLYARAGIADYWVVNLGDARLEVYRSPQPDPTQAYGHRYAVSSILQRSDVASPLVVPHVQVQVTELLG